MYDNNDYRNYLAHHGILGMHWGIRRYQPYSTTGPRKGGKTGKEIGEAKRVKKGLIRRTGIRLRAAGQSLAAIPRDVKNAKSWHRKASAIFGHQHEKSKAEIHAKAQKDLAEASRTKLGQQYHKSKGENYGYEAQYQKKVLDMTLKRRLAESFVKATYLSTPYSRLSGRTTVRGEMTISNLLTGGIGSLAADVAYITNKKLGDKGLTASKVNKMIDTGYSKASKKLSEKGVDVTKYENKATKAAERAKSASDWGMHGYNEYGQNISKLAKKEERKAAKEAASKLIKANSPTENTSFKKPKTKEEREAFKKKLRDVDPDVARNKQTKRVAMDYHILDDNKFRRKYLASKNTFAKRYVKTKGDTYSSGLRKAALATAINARAKDVSYYDFRTGKKKTIKNNGKRAVRALATDVGYSKLATDVGYKKAEEQYNSLKRKNNSV